MHVRGFQHHGSQWMCKWLSMQTQGGVMKCELPPRDFFKRARPRCVDTRHNRRTSVPYLLSHTIWHLSIDKRWRTYSCQKNMTRSESECGAALMQSKGCIDVRFSSCIENDNWTVKGVLRGCTNFTFCTSYPMPCIPPYWSVLVAYLVTLELPVLKWKMEFMAIFQPALTWLAIHGDLNYNLEPHWFPDHTGRAVQIFRLSYCTVQ